MGKYTDAFDAQMKRTEPAKKVKPQKVVEHQIEPRDNMSYFQQSLSRCTYFDNTLRLPFERLDNYQEIRDALLKCGAKYKNNTFIFPSDAKPYIDRLMGGEVVNLKKEFQFFATPSELADEMAAFIAPEKGDVILEPSAGQGALIKALRQQGFEGNVDYCELMDINRGVLGKMSNITHLGDDFLTTKFSKRYDKVIANPPFNKNQDIDHVRKMYEVCKQGGRIVTITSKHWQNSNNKKETAFRDWLDEIGAVVEDVEGGKFKESGTMISTVMIIIDKKLNI